MSDRGRPRHRPDQRSLRSKSADLFARINDFTVPPFLLALHNNPTPQQDVESVNAITRASARGVQVTLDSSSPRQPQPQFPQFKDFVRCSRKNSLRETCESAITIDWNYH